MAEWTRDQYMTAGKLLDVLATLTSNTNPDGTEHKTKVDGTVALDAATLTALENTTAAQGIGGTSAWLVGGTTFTVNADLTRPANATPYAIYDIIANQASGTTVQFMQFDTTKVNGSGYITKARLETDRTAEAAQYRLWLFRVPETGLTTRLTNLGDNDLFPLKFTNRAHRIGYIDFTTFVTGGSGSDSAVAQRDDIRLKYGLATGDSKLYGVLINLTAQTPQSAQNYSTFLSFESNT